MIGDVTEELRRRGLPIVAAKLNALLHPRRARVAEALRLLSLAETLSSRDPALATVTARTSLLRHQIEQTEENDGDTRDIAKGSRPA
jgi:CII-binding regulator of phage lambda lysogenization HflD